MFLWNSDRHRIFSLECPPFSLSTLSPYPSLLCVSSTFAATAPFVVFIRAAPSATAYWPRVPGYDLFSHPLIPAFVPAFSPVSTLSPWHPPHHPLPRLRPRTELFENWVCAWRGRKIITVFYWRRLRRSSLPDAENNGAQFSRRQAFLERTSTLQHVRLHL